MKTYAVIPTHNRPAELAELLDSIPADVHVLVIDNASEPETQFHLPLRFLGRRIQVSRVEEQPPNLSRLWNLGLDWAEKLHRATGHAPTDPVRGYVGADAYAVAILNDDLLLPRGFLWTMSAELANHQVDISFPGAVGQRCYVNRMGTNAPGLGLRMTGWCFMVRGGSGLRADERLRWWCGDDDLERQAAAHGRGTVRFEMTPGQAAELKHRYPDQSTAASPALQVQTALDMDTYVAKWGDRPW